MGNYKLLIIKGEKLSNYLIYKNNGEYKIYSLYKNIFLKPLVVKGLKNYRVYKDNGKVISISKRKLEKIYKQQNKEYYVKSCVKCQNRTPEEVR